MDKLLAELGTASSGRCRASGKLALVGPDVRLGENLVPTELHVSEKQKTCRTKRLASRPYQITAKTRNAESEAPNHLFAEPRLSLRDGRKVLSNWCVVVVNLDIQKKWLGIPSEPVLGQEWPLTDCIA